MAEYIKLYRTVNEYLQTEDNTHFVSSIIPGVAYVEEDEGVRYNKVKGPCIKLIFEIEYPYDYDLTRLEDCPYVGVWFNGEFYDKDNWPEYVHLDLGHNEIELELEPGAPEYCLGEGGCFYGTYGAYFPEGIKTMLSGTFGSGTGSGIYGNGDAHLPSTLEIIENEALIGAFHTPNTSIELPNVRFIGDTNFDDTDAITSVTFGPKLEYISGASFFNCPNLSEITCYATTAPELIDYNPPVWRPFNRIAETGTLYYPAGSDYSSWMAKLPSGWTSVEI